MPVAKSSFLDPKPSPRIRADDEVGRAGTLEVAPGLSRLADQPE